MSDVTAKCAKCGKVFSDDANSIRATLYHHITIEDKVNVPKEIELLIEKSLL